MGNMFRCTLKSGGASGTGIPLIVTCSDDFAGETITATDGTTTLTAQCPSSSPYTVEFSLPNVGTWTASGVYGGTTYYSEPVTITPYETNLEGIPEGATVTPTDDIQTWLHCANIWNKSYTTLQEVLADGTSLTALIASNNAVDYMVRSTTWATDVCADSSAMTKIGANDYCAESLLADSSWRNAIVNSTYFESVLTTKVPTMTSNTTPSGIASGDSKYASSSDYDAWHAFDNNFTVRGWLPANTTNQKVMYQFPSSVKIYKARIRIVRLNGTNSLSVKGYAIGSSDGSSWNNLSNEINSSTVNDFFDIPLNTYADYQHFGFKVTGGSAPSSSNMHGYKLQFYGRPTA